MVKMVDVAEHAGVSIKTVSRVLNNEAHVKDHIRKRVFESVKTLGYVPSASARNLRSRRTYALHFIAHSPRSNFLHSVQSGALVACQNLGYNFFWDYLSPDVADNPKALKAWCENLIKHKRPDGILLTPPYTNDKTINSLLNVHNLPIVRIGPNQIIDNNITVKIDDRLAGRDATQHLLDLGHKDIAFIRGIENQSATHERFKGYCDALNNAGITVDDSLVFSGEFSFASGMAAGEAIMTMQNRPSAVFAANDDMAAGVIVAAHKNNVKIPDDISIIGFDDSEMAERIWPPLTTIRQPRVEYGERSTELLIKMAGSRSRQRYAVNTVELMDYKLILRASTSAPPNK